MDQRRGGREPGEGLSGVIYRRTELIWEMTKRQLRDRHMGQVLGSVWVFGHPLLLMLVYMFLFAYVFPTRFGTGGGQDYAANVLAGIVSWLAFQDLLSRAPSIFVGHANMVRQIVFPVEVLPVKTALASAIPYISGLVFTIVYSAFSQGLGWIVLAMPLVVLFQVVAMIGAAFLLSSVGVFFRDLQEFVVVFCTFNLFAQPILFNPYATPDFLNYVFMINPFSYLVWCWQDALYWGYFAHPQAWVAMPILSLGSFVAGWFTFQKTRHQFGDVL